MSGIHDEIEPVAAIPQSASRAMALLPDERP